MQQLTGAGAHSADPGFAVWLAVVAPFNQSAGKDFGRTSEVNAPALRGGSTFCRIPFELHSQCIRVTRIYCKRRSGTDSFVPPLLGESLPIN